MKFYNKKQRALLCDDNDDWSSGYCLAPQQSSAVFCSSFLVEFNSISVKLLYLPILYIIGSVYHQMIEQIFVKICLAGQVALRERETKKVLYIKGKSAFLRLKARKHKLNIQIKLILYNHKTILIF